ncbi:MAG: Ig-like domain-containing protein [Rudaea sp.]
MFIGLVFSGLTLAADYVPAGDIAPRANPDGAVEQGDVQLLQRILLGEIVPTELEKQIVDVAPVGHPDGVVDISDLLVLQRAALEFISLPFITVGPADQPDPLYTYVSDIINGEITITGRAGGLFPGATVNVTNMQSGAVVTVTANADGSFSARIAARLGDNLSMVVRNPTGDPSPPTVVNTLGIAIAQPADGATASGASIIINGTFGAPHNSAITVNGVVPAVYGSQFFATLPLSSGSNTFTATVTTPDGHVASHSINVTATSSGPYPVEVSVSPDRGMDPLTVTFNITNNTGQPLARTQIDFGLGNNYVYDSVQQGVPADQAVTNVYYYSWIFPAKVTVTDAQGNVYVFPHVVTVHDLYDLDATLRGTYNSMLDHLRVGDVTGALASVSGGAHDKYQAVFNALGTNLPTVVDALGTLRDGSIGGEMAEYVLQRQEYGRPRAYYLYFLRGEDGVWRIDGM